ncbi:hypothetical protein Tco_1018788 [Tanacetum coccineum]|uniref:Uncharacterized protein n=1 Tax=Tanacetum coccineum TaxID=301880 RepID=A0ABQ5FWQ2_9ASTR
MNTAPIPSRNLHCFVINTPFTNTNGPSTTTSPNNYSDKTNADTQTIQLQLTPLLAPTTIKKRGFSSKGIPSKDAPILTDDRGEPITQISKSAKSFRHMGLNGAIVGITANLILMDDLQSPSIVQIDHWYYEGEPTGSTALEANHSYRKLWETVRGSGISFLKYQSARNIISVKISLSTSSTHSKKETYSSSSLRHSPSVLKKRRLLMKGLKRSSSFQLSAEPFDEWPNIIRLSFEACSPGNMIRCSVCIFAADFSGSVSSRVSPETCPSSFIGIYMRIVSICSDSGSYPVHRRVNITFLCPVIPFHPV